MAKNYNPKFIVGIDIDENLIKIANKNFKNFFDKSKDATDCNEYPTSFKLAYGNLDKNKSLPDNVKFKQVILKIQYYYSIHRNIFIQFFIRKIMYLLILIN